MKLEKGQVSLLQKGIGKQGKNKAKDSLASNNEALNELSDEMLMMMYRPARAFALGVTAPDPHIKQDNADPQLFYPEAFTVWREMVGLDTERDREDMEGFKRRKVG